MTPTPVLTINSSYYVHFYEGNLPYLELPRKSDYSIHIGLADKDFDCYCCSCGDCPLNDRILPCEGMALKLLEETHPDLESTNPEYFL